ncbi:MAG: NF038129 family PEP-CTERM protein [Syntrophobacteraceae bacterium]
MKFIKVKLFVIAFVLLVAGSAFASSIYDISVNTHSLFGQTGYLYLQYVPVNAASSIVTVSGFTTDGSLAITNDTAYVVDGSAVTGTLPNPVTFENTNFINDYNHKITFGNYFAFQLSFSNLASGGESAGSSTFSLGLFANAEGSLPSLRDTVDTGGTLAWIDLGNDGTTDTRVLVPEVTVSAVPEPCTVLLLSLALVGIAVFRKWQIGV